MPFIPLSPPKTLGSLSTDKTALLCHISTFFRANPAFVRKRVSIMDLGHDTDDFTVLLGGVLFDYMGGGEQVAFITALEPETVRAEFCRKCVASLGAWHIPVAAGLPEKEWRLREKGGGAGKKGRAEMGYHVAAPAEYEQRLMELFNPKAFPGTANAGEGGGYDCLFKTFLASAGRKCIINTAGFETHGRFCEAHPDLITRENLDLFASQGGTLWDKNYRIAKADGLHPPGEHYHSKRLANTPEGYILGSSDAEDHLIGAPDASNHMFHDLSESVYEIMQEKHIPTQSTYKTTAFQTRLTLRDYIPLRESGHALGETMYQFAEAVPKKYYEDACDCSKQVMQDWRAYIQQRTWFGEEISTAEEEERFNAGYTGTDARGREAFGKEKAAYEGRKKQHNKSRQAELTSSSSPPDWESFCENATVPQYDLWAFMVANPELSTSIGLYDETPEGDARQTLGPERIHHSLGTSTKGGLNVPKAELVFRTIMEGTLLMANTIAEAETQGLTEWSIPDESGRYIHVGTKADGRWKCEVMAK